MSTSSPYQQAVQDTRHQLDHASIYLDARRPEPVANAVMHAGRMIASALLAIAESNRPQPAQVHVTVADAVVDAVKEAAR